VDLRDTLDVDVGFNTVKAVRLLAKQLRDQGLDPDKYEFVNWTVTCDVQVKEENKS
jgi:hypothetical protein